MIELKKEYTLLLSQILIPIILEGLQHLYNESKKNSNKNNILKTFQLLLKAIPSWDSDIIRKEIERISTKTKEYPWMTKLIQTVFKLNIMINGLEPSEVMKKDIDMSLFIHSIYIECARQFWMDPFLFYHEYSSLEQKKNYCEIMKIIECCIENAIRRLLPLNAIFEKFLGQQTFNGKSLDLFEAYNMPLILDMPIELEKEKEKEIEKIEIQDIPEQNRIVGGGFDNNIQQTNNIIQPVNDIIQQNPIQNGFIGGFNNETNEHNINEKILNIINKNSILSDSNENNHFTVNNHSANDMQNPMMQNQMMQNQMMQNPMMQNPMMQNPMMQNPMMQNPMMQNPMMQNPMMQNPMMQNPMMQNPMMQPNKQYANRHHSDRKSSSTLKRIVHESIRQTQNTATKTNSNSDIKNKILKDLDSDTMTYNPEENAENYQDIFSNSDMKHTVNTNEKMEKKSREKFFNNYLNI